MSLVHSTEIAPPSMRVSPPAWAMALFWTVSLGVLLLLVLLPLPGPVIKYAAPGIYGLVLLVVAVKQRQGNLLVTMQANHDGLYFQAGEANRYIFVPWENVGPIEKAVYPLNSRGLRVEVTGEPATTIADGRLAAEARSEDGRTWVYTIPQLNDRDRLIERLESCRRGLLP